MPGLLTGPADVEWVRCETASLPCAVDVPAAWEPRWLEVLVDARGFLSRVGAWPAFERPLLVVTGAPVHALTVPDAAPFLGAGYQTRPAVLLADDVWPDVDVVVHELTHAWLQRVAGAGPRWVVKAGVASTERAAVHEAVADFLAAVHRGGPMVGRASTPEPLEARTLTEVRRCPEDWSGSAHDDAQVVSSALWALRGVVPSDEVVAAVVVAAPRSETVRGFSSAMREALSAAARPAWARLVEAQGLERCDQPIRVTASAPASATVDRFWLPGVGDVDAGATVAAPQAFVLSGRSLQEVTVSLQATQPLSLDVTAGASHFRVDLAGGARPAARFTLESPVDEVQVRVVSANRGPAAYNDVVMAGAAAPASAAGPLVAMLVGLLVVLGLAGWRARRSSSRAHRT
ncbi:MAG: hypothetical protein SFW67_27825 [Myxococcaceae bacterium]|nr:hypothetical protein [Myxococcaceae bacterium]